MTQLRELEKADFVFDESKGDKNKRKVIMKTIQTWFNDYEYDWSDENDSAFQKKRLVFPYLIKLTKRLELATQFVIGRNKYAATEYQVGFFKGKFTQLV